MSSAQGLQAHSDGLDTGVVDTQPQIEAHTVALHHIDAMDKHCIALGLWLIKMEDQKLWDMENFPKYAAYCAAPRQSGGLSLQYRSRMTVMQVARRFVLELQVPANELVEISHSNLTVFLPVVNEDNVDEVVSDAKSLAYADCQDRKRAYLDGEEILEATEEPEICTECGQKIRGKK